MNTSIKVKHYDGSDIEDQEIAERVEYERRLFLELGLDRCGDCNQVCTEYILKDEVWNSIVRLDETLCLSCMSKRLGREIVKSDLMAIPINYILGHLPFGEASEEDKALTIAWWDRTLIAPPPEEYFA